MKLNYEGFENNLFKVSTLHHGVQYLFKFDNNYGASVINCYGSYSTRDKPWELAIVKFDSNGDYDLIYDTNIANDVIGYLNDEGVRNLLKRISELDN